LKKDRTLDEEKKAAMSKEEILTRSTSEYEAVVAIAKEARRLNAVPGVFLEKGEKALPKAVKNFVEGKVEYQVENRGEPGAKDRKRRRKTK
jgi:DNA-directed RNA polymerase subunit K/omega